MSGSENKNMGGPADLETVESEATATLTADEMEITNDRYIYFFRLAFISEMSYFYTIFSRPPPCITRMLNWILIY